MVVNYKATAAAFLRVSAKDPFTDFYPYHVALSQSVSLTGSIFQQSYHFPLSRGLSCENEF